MSDPILSKGDVAKIQTKSYGLTGSVSGDIDALAASHEALRAKVEDLRRQLQSVDTEPEGECS